MTKQIPLSRGLFSLVDDCDFDSLNQWKWYAANIRNGHFYAAHDRGKQGIMFMHRLIMSAQNGVQVDHKNRDTLDNRRSNLRLCTSAQNNANAGRRIDNKSGYKGVCWHPRDRNWKAQAQIDNTHYHLGYFDNILDAARAYNHFAIEHHGQFACLNDLTGLDADTAEQLRLDSEHWREIERIERKQRREGKQRMRTDFGELLHAQRKSLGLTQAQLAERVGVSPQVISRYEAGKIFPTTKTLAAIRDVIHAGLDAGNTGREGGDDGER